MQELSISIKQRISKTKQVIEQALNSDSIRFLRQQEKIRCQKQNFILAMMRANKIMSINLKKSYFHISFQLMKLLEQSFDYKQTVSIEEDFLNEFVHLYTTFFAYFETKFTFKTKIKNFLRPTNHNLIVDLIKYFVDFTRDYYVQTLFWKMRSSNKNQMPVIDDSSTMQQNVDEINLMKVKPLGVICRNYSSVTDPGQNAISPRKKTDQMQQKKMNQNIYEILDVILPPITISNLKQNFLTLNVESLKIKINELFRDQKSRNCSIKKIYDDYSASYKQKYNKKELSNNSGSYVSKLKKNDQLNYRCLPLRMLLSAQKSGFSVIIIQVDTKRTKASFFSSNQKLYSNSNISSQNNSPSKLQTQNSLSPLKISQRVNQGEQTPKSDYFLTSMKVLRVSQNFLPPLINSTTSIINNQSSSRKQARQKQSNESGQRQKNQNSSIPFSLKLKRMTDEVEDQVPFINQISNSHNVLVRSTSFKKTTAQKQKRRLQSYNNYLYSGQFKILQRQSSENKPRRKNSQDDEIYRPSNKKLNIKKKLINQRRNYDNGAYFPSRLNSKSGGVGGFESQQKILQWLQKIKNLKQIQRKKILGMNF